MVVKFDDQESTKPTSKAFLEIFFAIDKDRDEEITKGQLKRYFETNRRDDDLIENWMKLFQLRKTNRLSLEDICEHLQLNIGDVRQQRSTQLKSAENSLSSYTDNQRVLGNDVQVIVDQMPMDMKLKITNEFRKLITDNVDFNGLKLTEYMKQFMDKSFSSSWVVLIVKGSYSTTFLHLEDCAFQFRLNNYSFVVWRTFFGFN
ncbi:unnamed protein product [Schistosoma mattheei]|uniref:Uncharacterized protein n=1 Tax=Schistosoma mattheei TaxID=31246 RepID=A0A183NH25_9TREM|nr:unnamed protein product [Schistosoma mattheei]